MSSYELFRRASCLGEIGADCATSLAVVRYERPLLPIIGLFEVRYFLALILLLICEIVGYWP